MAQKKRSARTNSSGSGSGPRRLGNQTTPAAASSGATRRAARSRKKNSSRNGWFAVGAVVIVLAGIIVWRVTAGSSNPAAGQSSGRNPVLASAALVQPVTTVNPTVFDQVGTNGMAAGFERTTVKTPALSGGKVNFVYFGAEYCPYCALIRWSLVAALSRFGKFTGLKETESAVSDGNIPTFSFLGSKYTSKYVTFSPYEYQDRNHNALETPPASVQKLVTKYDFPPYTTQTNEGGIPFLSVGNQYIAGGDPAEMSALYGNGTLVNGGPGRAAIAQSLQTPFSATGTAAGGKIFDGTANYIAAAICLTNGGKPGNVCTSKGVQAAAKVLSAQKPIK